MMLEDTNSITDEINIRKVTKTWMIGHRMKQEPKFLLVQIPIPKKKERAGNEMQFWYTWEGNTATRLLHLGLLMPVLRLLG